MWHLSSSFLLLDKPQSQWGDEFLSVSAPLKGKMLKMGETSQQLVLPDKIVQGKVGHGIIQSNSVSISITSSVLRLKTDNSYESINTLWVPQCWDWRIFNQKMIQFLLQQWPQNSPSSVNIVKHIYPQMPKQIQSLIFPNT